MRHRALLGLDGRDARHHTIFPGRNLIRRAVPTLSWLAAGEWRDLVRGGERIMSIRPAAGRSESIPEGGVEEQRLHAVSDAVTSKTWQLATLLVPIVLTTWLTYWVSQKENNIKQQI